jgi:hypothetical protein
MFSPVGPYSSAEPEIRFGLAPAFRKPPCAYVQMAEQPNDDKASPTMGGEGLGVRLCVPFRATIRIVSITPSLQGRASSSRKWMDESERTLERSFKLRME